MNQRDPTRKRVNLSFTEEEVRRIEKQSGHLKLTSWCKWALMRTLARLEREERRDG